VTSLSSPTIAKAFNPTSIASGGNSLVTLTLSNSNASVLTGGAFTDTLSNMSAVGGAAGGTCTGASSNILGANATSLSFTGITIPASGSCTVTFSVASSTVGIQPNSTSGVTTTQTLTAGTASNTANLTVLDTTPPTVVSYSVLFGSQSFNMAGSPRNRLPWQITGIRVVFSEPVHATTASLTGLSVTGIAGNGTSTVTWTISPVTNLPSTVTKVLGTTANAVTDLAGNSLGGGADFSQTLKVLYADFNDDGIVNSSDLVGVNAEKSPHPYNIFADLNGDGVVDANDVHVVQLQLGTSNP